MDLHRRHLQEQLHRRELESTELRRNLHELNTKFVRLEEACEINLQSQKRREIEFNLLKLENEDFRKLNEESLRIKTEMHFKLTETSSERDHWKNMATRQKKMIKRGKIRHADDVEAVKRECEDILKKMRDSTEKHFRELVDLYEDAKSKASHFEEQANELEKNRKIFENRTFEMANLIETLKRFDVNINTLCHLVVEALKNLTDRGNSFESTLKGLRQLTWTSTDKVTDSELDTLRHQNLVLREIVKSLKRRANLISQNNASQKDDSPMRDKNELKIENLNNNFTSRDEIEGTTDKCERNVPYISNISNDTCNNLRSTPENNNGSRNKEDTTCDRKDIRHSKEKFNHENIIGSNRDTKVLYIESHLNGTFYEEYVIKFSNDREMKIKHSPEMSATMAQLNLEFVDCEDKYQEVYLDKVLIFLRNIYATSINIKRSGVNCTTQTTKTKISHKLTQTMLSGINNYNRLNVGFTMLNSEKRAIEKSLSSLERTVADLKLNALSQAQSMMGKKSKFLENNEFFECIKLLTR